MKKLLNIFIGICFIVSMSIAEVSYAKGGSSSSGGRSFSSGSSFRSSSSSAMRSTSSSQASSNAFSKSNASNYAASKASAKATTIASKPVVVNNPNVTKVGSVNVIKPITTPVRVPQTVNTVPTKTVEKIIVVNKDRYYNRNRDSGYVSPVVVPVVISGNSGVQPVAASPVHVPQKKIVEPPKLKMDFIPEKYCKNWVCAIK